MKVCTYYEDINFKHQERLLSLWKQSWESRGFEAIILNRNDAKLHPFYQTFRDRLELLHKDITNKPLDKYGLSCWLRWLAYAAQPEEKFYVCDYDVINHNFVVVEPDVFLHLLDGDCPCIASGKPSQFYDLCQKFVNVPEENKQNFIETFNEFGFPHYHDQEFFRICQKLSITDIKATRRRDLFFGIPSEGEFWKKQLVHYGHSLCHKLCDAKGIKFDEEARCNIVEEHLKITKEPDLSLWSCIEDFTPVCGGVRNKDYSLNEMGKQLTLLGIKQLGPSINAFLKFLNLNICKTQKYEEENNKTETSEKLKELFNKFGSDKSIGHDYHLVYGEVFDKLDKNAQLNILEIGLGSQNPSLPSRMAGHYTVGSSVRAYKEYFPNAQIFGADIDKDTLFSEERIKTSYVDQLNLNSFEEMHKNFNSPNYDLIIEDGLHSFVASLNTLNFCLKYTKTGGIIVLEDLANQRNFWNMITTLLIFKGYNAKLIDSRGLMLVIYL